MCVFIEYRVAYNRAIRPCRAHQSEPPIRPYLLPPVRESMIVAMTTSHETRPRRHASLY